MQHQRSFRDSACYCIEPPNRGAPLKSLKPLQLSPLKMTVQFAIDQPSRQAESLLWNIRKSFKRLNMPKAAPLTSLWRVNCNGFQTSASGLAAPAQCICHERLFSHGQLSICAGMPAIQVLLMEGYSSAAKLAKAYRKAIHLLPFKECSMQLLQVIWFPVVTGGPITLSIFFV